MGPHTVIEEDFNGNHTRLQGQERSVEKSTIQEQRSILWSSRINPWVQIRQKSWAKATKRFYDNIFSRIDPSKVRIDPFLSVMTSPRFLGYKHLGFRAKNRSLWEKLHYIFKVAIFQIFSKGRRAFLGWNAFFLRFFKRRQVVGLD